MHDNTIHAMSSSSNRSLTVAIYSFQTSALLPDCSVRLTFERPCSLYAGIK